MQNYIVYFSSGKKIKITKEFFAKLTDGEFLAQFPKIQYESGNIIMLNTHAIDFIILEGQEDNFIVKDNPNGYATYTVPNMPGSGTTTTTPQTGNPMPTFTVS